MIVARHEVPGDMRKIARPSGSIERIFGRLSGTGALCTAIQALRAWLLSACPSGTKVKAVGLEFGHLLTPGGPA
jgi:hypothetical protein